MASEGFVRALVREWFEDLEDFAIAEIGQRFTDTDYAAFELWTFLEGKDLRVTDIDRENILPKLQAWFVSEANKLHRLRYAGMAERQTDTPLRSER